MRLDDIRSNNIRRCARCGIPITPANDSGWEVFVDDGRQTQPICGWCWAMEQMEDGDGEKADEGGVLRDRRDN